MLEINRADPNVLQLFGALLTQAVDNYVDPVFNRSVIPSMLSAFIRSSPVLFHHSLLFEARCALVRFHAELLPMRMRLRVRGVSKLCARPAFSTC